MTPNIDHRNFILNLSSQIGQYLAASEGFVIPSAAVQYQENIDVIRNWKRIEGTGVTPYIHNAAMWMTSVIEQPDWTQEKYTIMYQTFASLMISNLLQLHEAGMIQFAHMPAVNIGIWDEERNGYVPMDTLEYSYKDEIGHLDNWEPVLEEEVEQ